MHAAFAAMGMVPPGPGLLLYKPITGATARLADTAVTITLQMPALSDASNARSPKVTPRSPVRSPIRAASCSPSPMPH